MQVLECKICHNKENNTHYTIREMMFGTRAAFDYFQCASCECLQIVTVPSNLTDFYPDSYNGHAQLDVSKYHGVYGNLKIRSLAATLFHTGGVNHLISKIFRSDKYKMIAKLPLTMESRILDVGAGMTNFLYPLFELGMSNVLSIDPFIKKDAVYKNGYSVLKKYLNDLNSKWDIIIFNHAFEHVPDPLKTLIDVEKCLDSSGTCILRIPTVSSYAWKHYKTNWFQLDAPRHLFLHSRKSIEMLAEQSGLTLTDVVYDSTYVQFTNSEKYAKDIAKDEPVKQSFLKRKLTKWKYARQAEHLNETNMGDQAAFFLKKK